jgi:hypothetical protein
MSRRWLIAILGVLIVGVGIAIGYCPTTADDGSHSVSCGSAESPRPVDYDKIDAENPIDRYALSNLSTDCAEINRFAGIGRWFVVGVGALILVGAVAIRPRARDTRPHGRPSDR